MAAKHVVFGSEAREKMLHGGVFWTLLLWPQVTTTTRRHRRQVLHPLPLCTSTFCLCSTFSQTQ